MSDRLKGIEHYDKRFGMIAISKGFITEQDLIKALPIQIQEEVESGMHRQVGQIQLELDIMDAKQIEQVVKETFMTTHKPVRGRICQIYHPPLAGAAQY